VLGEERMENSTNGTRRICWRELESCKEEKRELVKKM